MAANDSGYSLSKQDARALDSDIEAGESDGLKAQMKAAGVCFFDEIAASLSKNSFTYYRHSVSDDFPSGKELHVIKRKAGDVYDPVVSLLLDLKPDRNNGSDCYKHSGTARTDAHALAWALPRR